MNVSKDILIKILKFANCRDSRLNIILTCKLWRDVFLEYVHSPWNYSGLAYAMEDGYLEYYKKWSNIAGKRWKPHQWDHHGFEKAVSNGHTEMVKYILAEGKIHPMKFSFNCVLLAEDNKEMLDLLLSDSRITDYIKKSKTFLKPTTLPRQSYYNNIK